ncbi:L-cysteine desulfidase family protein [Orbus wheelerorum]|uniref:L-cysteine desulfidase family protein n=1 Tax=Orbus wheelerorum TaxID=3074111 RepID=UPI00370DE054
MVESVEVIWHELIEVLKRQVLPATGCTEPISLAFASAVAAKYLTKNNIERIEAKVSPNLMKNGMGVTVPSTGMVGLSIAAAVGVIGGDADAGLDVLQKITAADVVRAKELLQQNCVSVSILPTDKPLYCEVKIYSQGDSARVCIEDHHTNIILIEHNNEVVFQKSNSQSDINHSVNIMEQVSIKVIYDFVSKIDFDDIKFILKAAELNDALSKEGLAQTYGLSIAHILRKQVSRGLLSDDLLTKIMIRTTAASDARMGGAALPAMSNSGSGNQGIAATMPVVVIADYIDADDDFLARALVLSHTIAIYIHSKFPPLSALCAASTASMGAAAGMVYLLDKGNFDAVNMAICNMVGDLTGIICDGASNSCALKVSTSASSAFKSVLMALDDVRVTGNEGIVCDCVESSINNLCALASNSMRQTDAQIIEIMASKP